MSFTKVKNAAGDYIKGEQLVELEQVLELALRERKTCATNLLYADYLSDIFHTYCSEMFKLALIRCYHAYFKATMLFQQNITDSPELDKLLATFEDSARKLGLQLDLEA